MELVDKLNKIAATAKIDTVLNSSTEDNNIKKSNEKSISSSAKKDSSKRQDKSNKSRVNSATSPADLTTKNEIHRVNIYLKKFLNETANLTEI